MTCISATLGLTDEQKHIQKMATDFARNELFPNMAQWDIEVRYASAMQKVSSQK